MDNFWNEFKKAEIELPKTILEAQRNNFNENIPPNTLVCEIKETQEDVTNPWEDTIGFLIDGPNQIKRKSVVYSMYILAPSLNNYRVLLFKVAYDISKVYPCTISNIYTGEPEIKCEDNGILKEKLKNILQSPSISDLVGVLLAQVS